ncbi:hypothetical protein CANARDRAFT_9872 [[Candida] arabinofermentans NRRL YB-2248]|uniref:Major facilitator superfamily (MFS) profile domain-containing protein n=1 Tax=[Candida] arabinofermentans NRRL YB-2248 TaxID=983967 RepID=A0A1E4SUH6_9ASCO|nr:hypothetical protein CANARDRAFT_9872 [[Candida] arabinofermentans NRRL YB-2248]
MSSIEEEKNQILYGVSSVLSAPVNFANKKTELKILSDDGSIILSPTPSLDPADPLNWSLARKIGIVIIVTVWSAAALSTQSFLQNFLPNVSERFPNESDSRINLLVTITSPLVAPGELLLVPIAMTFGRRLCLLIAVVLLIVSSVVGATTTTYEGLLAARIIEGLAGGPTDAICFTIVQEISFTHERGLYIGAVAMGQLIVQFIFGVVTNYMAVYVGFKWPFVLFSCVSGVCFIALYLFMPETRYKRTTNEDEQVSLKEWKGRRPLLSNNPDFEPFTFKRQTQVWFGKGDDEYSDFWLIFRQMAKMCADPIVIWVALINTVSTGGMMGFSIYYATMLESSPWFWNAGNVGLISFAGLVAALFNIAVLGYGSDRLLIWYAKRREGKVSPENRLIPLIIPFVFSISYLVGFGFLAQDFFGAGTTAHWFSVVFIYFCCYVSFGGILETTYAYLSSVNTPEMSLAAMTVASVVRDMASFGMSYGITPFADNCGYKTSFGVYAVLIAFFSLFGIPVYLYGGKLRSKLNFTV